MSVYLAMADRLLRDELCPNLSIALKMFSLDPTFWWLEEEVSILTKQHFVGDLKSISFLGFEAIIEFS